MSNSIKNILDGLTPEERGILYLMVGNSYFIDLSQMYFTGKEYHKKLFLKVPGTVIEGYISSNGVDFLDISIEDTRSKVILYAIKAIKGSNGRWSVRFAYKPVGMGLIKKSSVDVTPHPFPKYMVVSPDSFSPYLSSRKSLSGVLKMLNSGGSSSWDYMKLALFISETSSSETKKYNSRVESLSNKLKDTRSRN